MTSVGIIGSGFGALAVAIELKRAGHTDLRLWERSDDLGGVWRDNTYPGAGCDVPSPLYSFSYEPNPHWTRRYALQEEIHAYIRSVADKHGITPLVRFGHEVVAATWNNASSTWTVTFADDREDTVDILVSAVGQLSRPTLPRIDGRRVVRRHLVPLRAVGPLLRPGRQVHRGRGLGRQRRAAHPPPGPRRPQAHRVPTLPQLPVAQARQALQGVPQDAVRGRPRSVSASSAPASGRSRSSSPAASTTSRGSAGSTRQSRCGISASRSRIRSCGPS